MELAYKNSLELAIRVIYGDVFGLPVRLLHAKTDETIKIEELANAIELVESYNKFSGKKVADTLRKMHDEGLIMSAKFGREFSPVLYVTIPFWTNQSTKHVHDKDKRRLSPGERESMRQRIVEILQEAMPDELGGGHHGWEIRAWWD
jgi:hypothetical protein